jgi:hypothetical protein
MENITNLDMDNILEEKTIKEVISYFNKHKTIIFDLCISGVIKKDNMKSDEEAHHA